MRFSSIKRSCSAGSNTGSWGCVAQLQMITAASAAIRIRHPAITPFRLFHWVAGCASSTATIGKCRIFRSGGTSSWAPQEQVTRAPACRISTGTCCPHSQARRYWAMQLTTGAISAKRWGQRRYSKHTNVPSGEAALPGERLTQLLSNMLIVRIFSGVPMDWFVVAFRIERLNLPARAAFRCPR